MALAPQMTRRPLRPRCCAHTRVQARTITAGATARTASMPPIIYPTASPAGAPAAGGAARGGKPRVKELHYTKQAAPLIDPTASAADLEPLSSQDEDAGAEGGVAAGGLNNIVPAGSCHTVHGACGMHPFHLGAARQLSQLPILLRCRQLAGLLITPLRPMAIKRMRTVRQQRRPKSTNTIDSCKSQAARCGTLCLQAGCRCCRGTAAGRSTSAT